MRERSHGACRCCRGARVVQAGQSHDAVAHERAVSSAASARGLVVVQRSLTHPLGDAGLAAVMGDGFQDRARLNADVGGRRGVPVDEAVRDGVQSRPARQVRTGSRYPGDDH